MKIMEGVSIHVYELPVVLPAPFWLYVGVLLCFGFAMRLVEWTHVVVEVAAAWFQMGGRSRVIKRLKNIHDDGGGRVCLFLAKPFFGNDGALYLFIRNKGPRLML